jgi:hypothetical protein
MFNDELNLLSKSNYLIFLLVNIFLSLLIIIILIFIKIFMMILSSTNKLILKIYDNYIIILF